MIISEDRKLLHTFRLNFNTFTIIIIFFSRYAAANIQSFVTCNVRACACVTRKYGFKYRQNTESNIP